MRAGRKRQENHTKKNDVQFQYFTRGGFYEFVRYRTEPVSKAHTSGIKAVLLLHEYAFATCGCLYELMQASCCAFPLLYRFPSLLYISKGIMKILVIEDEKDLRETLVRSLQRENYTVEEADHFDSALEKLLIYSYDCILLDIGLPGGSGLDLLAALKKEGKEDSVIIVSAKDSLDDKIEGLNLGADDYLPKPFHMAELHARVRSVIRRKGMHGQPQLTLNNLVIDPKERGAAVDGKPMSFNRKEFDVLLYLAMNQNRLVSKHALAEHVWGDRIDEADSFDFVYSQIKNLRRKLKEHDAAVEISAIYGVGYKLTT